MKTLMKNTMEHELWVRHRNKKFQIDIYNFQHFLVFVTFWNLAENTKKYTDQLDSTSQTTALNLQIYSYMDKIAQ